MANQHVIVKNKVRESGLPSEQVTENIVEGKPLEPLLMLLVDIACVHSIAFD